MTWTERAATAQRDAYEVVKRAGGSKEECQKAGKRAYYEVEKVAVVAGDPEMTERRTEHRRKHAEEEQAKARALFERRQFFETLRQGRGGR